MRRGRDPWRRRKRRSRALAAAAVAGTGIAASLFALTASTTVPTTRAESYTTPITANTLKPVACAGLTLTAIVIGSGNFNATGAAELVIGSSSSDDIQGEGGNDCILGGAGDDKLNGRSGGIDVCIGGPGSDLFIQCETAVQ